MVAGSIGVFFMGYGDIGTFKAQRKEGLSKFFAFFKEITCIAPGYIESPEGEIVHQW